MSTPDAFTGPKRRPPLRGDPVRIRRMLDGAETAARNAGSVLTPIRRRVYEVLLCSDSPLNAYHVLPHLEGVASVQPATAYRALDWLEAVGLVRKIRSISKYVALVDGPSEKPVVFAICRECGSAEQIATDAPVEPLLGLASARGFRQSASVIELVSVCAAHADTQTAEK